MLFKIFIWSTLDKLDILLLDEPDLHFDPEFSRIFFKVIDLYFIQNGIQVIMITHRVDTIALAPHDSIFENQVVEENGSKKFILSPRQKLHALFKLTSNLREINNFHIKVYTESIDDANFFNGVYRNLMSYCNRIRLQNKVDFREEDHEPSDRFIWKGKFNSLNTEEPNEIEIGRVLSRRFQMDFCATCCEDGYGGGKSEVIKMVERANRCQANIYKSIEIKSKDLKPLIDPRMEKPLIDPRMEKPFGLIDRDCDDKNENHEPVVLLERHSLENFIYDPIILASVFNENELNFNDELNQIILSISSLLLKQLNNLQKDFVNELQKNLDSYFKILLTELLDKASLEDHGFENLQTTLELLEQKIKKIPQISNDSKQDSKQKRRKRRTQNDDNLGHDIWEIKTEAKKFEFRKTIITVFLNDKKDLNILINENCFVGIKYPRIFFDLIGHDIENVMENMNQQNKNKIINEKPVENRENITDPKPKPKKKKKKEKKNQKNKNKDEKKESIIKKQLIEKLFQPQFFNTKPYLCLPVDLIKSMLELNGKISKNCNDILKPNV